MNATTKIYQLKTPVEAVQWTGTNKDEVIALIGDDYPYCSRIYPNHAFGVAPLPGLGHMIVMVGDYVIRNGDKFDVMSASDFADKYAECIRL